MTKPIDIDLLPDQVERYLQGARDTADTGALMEAHAAYNQEVVGRLEGKLRELETMNAELRRLDKIKDDFIQLTAHELRTPLTLIYGYSRLLQESPVVLQLKESSAEMQSFIVGLVDSIERMSRVINEILTVSRIATGRIQLAVGPANLREIVSDIVASYHDVTRQRNLLVSFDPEQWPTLIQADGDLLRLAIQNVLGNAVKYTPDGGVINIFARSGVGNILITVQDTGIGINKADQGRIFDRFFSADDIQLHSTSKTAFGGGGLGLGLAICRGIVEAHGGKIWVESEGRDEEHLPGSTFYIDLPLQARTASPRRAVAETRG